MFRCALLVALLLFAIPRTASAQSSADTAAARELFFEGVSLAKLGKWPDAVDRYRRSLALKHSAVTLYSLGVAQKNAGKLVDALESFRAFLRDGDEANVAKYRTPAEQAIGELDGRVARVTIAVAPAPETLAVTVDGSDVPIAGLGRARLVDPGEHEVQARAEGHHDAAQRFSVREGEETTVSLALEPLPAPEKPAAPGSDKSEIPILPIGLMAGGAVVLGVGIGVGLSGVSDAESAKTSDGDDASSARTKAAVGDTLGAVGIAAIAVGAVLLVIDLTDDDAAWLRRSRGLAIAW